mgnify:CR=1 FL=1
MLTIAEKIFKKKLKSSLLSFFIFYLNKNINKLKNINKN